MISVVLNVSNEGTCIKDGLFNSNSIKKFRCKHLHYKLCASDVVNSRHCNVMQYNNYCFSAAELVVEFFLDASAPPLGLRATLNPLCAEPPSNFFVQGLFGVRQAPNKECIYLQSSTQSFADTDTVFIELNLVLKSEQYAYCARTILNERENTIVDGKYI